MLSLLLCHFQLLRPQLFEGWITLSTGQITIQRISVPKTNHSIHWIVIYPVDSVIHLLNNPGLISNTDLTSLSVIWRLFYVNLSG